MKRRIGGWLVATVLASVAAVVVPVDVSADLMAESVVRFSGEPGRVGVVTVVAVDTEARGFLQVLPCDGELRGWASVSADGPRQIRSGVALVEFDARGEACLFNRMESDVVVDLQGYLGGVEVEQRRVLDTRESVRPVAGSVTAFSGRPGATAVVSVAAVDTGGRGFVQVLGCGVEPGGWSSVNADGAGQVRSGLAVVEFDAGGRACVFNRAETDVVVDLQGYLTGFEPANNRLVDTREAIRPAAESLTVFRGRPGSSGVVSVAAVDTSGRGFVQVLRCDAVPGEWATVNADGAGQVRSGTAVVEFDASGEACVFNKSETDIVVDLQGYLDDYQPDTRRIVDTRGSTGLSPECDTAVFDRSLVDPLRRLQIEWGDQTVVPDGIRMMGWDGEKITPVGPFRDGTHLWITDFLGVAGTCFIAVFGQEWTTSGTTRRPSGPDGVFVVEAGRDGVQWQQEVEFDAEPPYDELGPGDLMFFGDYEMMYEYHSGLVLVNHAGDGVEPLVVWGSGSNEVVPSVPGFGGRLNVSFFNDLEPCDVGDACPTIRSLSNDLAPHSDALTVREGAIGLTSTFSDDPSGWMSFVVFVDVDDPDGALRMVGVDRDDNVSEPIVFPGTEREPGEAFCVADVRNELYFSKESDPMIRRLSLDGNHVAVRESPVPGGHFAIGSSSDCTTLAPLATGVVDR